MNQPVIEYKMPEQEKREIKKKLFDVIYPFLSSHEKASNDAGPFTVKLVNSLLDDFEYFIESHKGGDLSDVQ